MSNVDYTDAITVLWHCSTSVKSPFVLSHLHVTPCMSPGRPHHRNGLLTRVGENSYLQVPLCFVPLNWVLLIDAMPTKRAFSSYHTSVSLKFLRLQKHRSVNIDHYKLSHSHKRKTYVEALSEPLKWGGGEKKWRQLQCVYILKCMCGCELFLAGKK